MVIQIFNINYESHSAPLFFFSFFLFLIRIHYLFSSFKLMLESSNRETREYQNWRNMVSWASNTNRVRMFSKLDIDRSDVLPIYHNRHMLLFTITKTSCFFHSFYQTRVRHTFQPFDYSIEHRKRKRAFQQPICLFTQIKRFKFAEESKRATKSPHSADTFWSPPMNFVASWPFLPCTNPSNQH